MKAEEYPPATVKESIVRLEERFSGFQSLIDERTHTTNDNIERLTIAVENMANGKADQKALEALEKKHDEDMLEVKALLVNAVTKTEFRLVTTVITTVMGLVIAGLTVWEKIKG